MLIAIQYHKTPRARIGASSPPYSNAEALLCPGLPELNHSQMFCRQERPSEAHQPDPRSPWHWKDCHLSFDRLPPGENEPRPSPRLRPIQCRRRPTD